MPLPVAAAIELQSEWAVAAEVGLRHEGGACGAGYLTEVVVERAFGEGPTGPILAWEPYDGPSTLVLGSSVLLFLEPTKKAAASCPSNTAVLRAVVPRGADTVAWEQLLADTAGGRQPLAPQAARARLVDPELEPEVVAWTLAHWPGEVVAADVPLLVSRIEADAASEALVRRAGDLLKRGPGLAAPDRDRLWSLVRTDLAGAAALVGVLATHEKDWLLEQMPAAGLPAWVGLPALRAAGVSSSVLRGTWPVVDGDPELLQDLGRFARGEWDSTGYLNDDPIGRLAGPPGEPNPWAPLVPPLLPALRPEDREVAIGALRTLGYEVEGLQARPGSEPPVRLQLVVSETEAWVEHQITRRTTLCDRVKLAVFLDDHKHRTGVNYRTELWRTADQPAGAIDLPDGGKCFVLGAGTVVRETVWLHDSFDVLEGEVTVSIEVTHDFRGVEAGLDAWTGRLATTATVPAERVH